MRSSFSNSIPSLQSVTGKFCLPTPRVMSGTYVTTAPTASVTSITIISGSVATVVTAAAHNVQVGMFVTISGSTIVDYNGIFEVISVTDSVTFGVAMLSTVTSPAMGTIVFQITSASGIPQGCAAVGTGTLAGNEFFVGDWLYDPAQGVVRQVTNIYDNTHWEFSQNFPSNVSHATVQLAARGVYRFVKVDNTLGAASGSLQGVTLPKVAVTYEDVEGLDPICGDATSTTFTISLLAKAQQ